MRMTACRLLVCLFSLLAMRCEAKQDQRTFLKNLLSDYNRNEPPSTDDNNTVVKVGFYILDIDSINEQTMDYSVSFYLRQSWNDPRLTFDPSDAGKDQIALPPEATESVWRPDTFFRAEKKAGVHTVTMPNKLIKLSSTGDIWYVLKISAVYACPMKLQKYPFDTQICKIYMESFAHTADILEYDWLPGGAADFDPGLEVFGYTVVDVILENCSQNYTAGRFPCQSLGFVITRDIGYFVSQVFFPSILIVMLSWIGFWLDPKSPAARVLVSLFTILIMTMVNTTAHASLPRISYITALDVWLGVCIVFVFSAAFELVVVKVVTGNGNRWYNVKNAEEGEVNVVDKVCKIAFPVCFVLFSVIYWIVYNA